MRKSKRFDELSPIECSEPGCHKKLKWNFVLRKQSGGLKCFKHWLKDQADKGHNVYHHFKKKGV